MGSKWFVNTVTLPVSGLNSSMLANSTTCKYCLASFDPPLSEDMVATHVLQAFAYFYCTEAIQVGRHNWKMSLNCYGISVLIF